MIRLALLPVAFAIGCFASQEAKPVKPTEFGAVSYFETRCARCHGPQGGFMTNEFAKGQDDEKLTASTRQMCDGPGGAPLKEDDLKVEVAYMRAISAGQPFLEWTSEKDGFSGEASVDKFKLEVDGKSTEIEVKDGLWNIPKGDKPVLRAGEGPKAVRLDLKEANISQPVERNADR